MVRCQAAEALSIIGTAAKEAIPALLEALNDKDSSVRGWVIGAISSMEQHARIAVPNLQRMLNDKNRNVARLASEALAEILALPRPPHE
jgi:HEAT repeat protein